MEKKVQTEYTDKAANRNINTITVTRKKHDNPHTDIKFLQIKLRHSKFKTDNLAKLTSEQGTDLLILQEAY